MARVDRPEVFPVIWCKDVAAIQRWAQDALGLEEVWSNDEHAELSWHDGGRVSLNVQADVYAGMGPGGVGLSLADRAAVEAVHKRAVTAGAEIIRGLEDTFVSFSFTARDPEGNQWWVHAETEQFGSLRD